MIRRSVKAGRKTALYRVKGPWTYNKVLIATLSALLVAVLFFYWNYKDRNIPQELIGDWNTTDPSHSDRYFSIGPTTISFTTGSGTISTGWITQIKTVPAGTSTLYTIMYDLQGTPNIFSFYYEIEKAAGQSIRFKNQKDIVWKKIERHQS